MRKRFSYGGQAVIEGVMIRGRRYVSIAVRRPGGDIFPVSWALNPLLTGRLRELPLVRGIVILVETLVLGMRALSHSANVALEQEGQELSSWALTGMLLVSLAFGIGLFFVAPLMAIGALDRFFTSDIMSNFVEGVIRLAILVGYIKLIGLMKDIKRVFAYHGAEHMAVHAYEANNPLEVAEVRKCSTAHARCGTAFLLVVMVVAILVFSFLGRPPMALRILSRIVLVPVIAAVSYEIIRFSGAHAANVLVRAIMYPSLALQALTTRQPDDAQIEVAICAMKGAIAADEGVEVGTASQTEEGQGGTAPEG